MGLALLFVKVVLFNVKSFSFCSDSAETCWIYKLLPVGYTCVVDQAGQVIGDPDIDEPTLEEKAAAAAALRQKELERPAYFKRYLEYCEQNENRHFRQWPYDQKAAKRPRIPQKCWN